MSATAAARPPAQWLYKRTRNDSFIVNVTNRHEEDLGGVKATKSAGCWRKHVCVDVCVWMVEGKRGRRRKIDKQREFPKYAWKPSSVSIVDYSCFTRWTKPLSLSWAGVFLHLFSEILHSSLTQWLTVDTKASIFPHVCSHLCCRICFPDLNRISCAQSPKVLQNVPQQLAHVHAV